MAKAKQGFSWAYNHDEMSVTVTDKSTEESVTYDASDLPQQISEQSLLYGIGKLLQDRNSQVAAAEKMPAFDRTWKQLCDGIWKAERTIGARFLPAIVEAIAKRKGCSVAAAQAAYRSLDDAQKAVLKENLAEDIAKIEEARAAQADVTLDDLI